MRLVRILLIPVALSLGAWIWWRESRPREISVCVLTDFSLRQRPDWRGILQSRFQQVARIYEKVGIRWKVTNLDTVDPSGYTRSLDARRATLTENPPSACNSDVIVSLTGQRDVQRVSSVLPFGNVAIVEDYLDRTDTENALILAREMARFFGATEDKPGSGTLMTEPPGSERFSPQTTKLIHAMRDYNFRGGSSELRGSWGGRVAKALAEAYRGTTQYPASAARQQVAGVLEASHYYSAAVLQLREAIQAAPNDSSARIALAMALLQDSQDDAARDELRQAARVTPNDYRIHSMFAAILAKSGDPEEATEELEKAIQLEPKNASLRVSLGSVLLVQMGRADDAIASFQEAMRLDPGSMAARQALANAMLFRAKAQTDVDQRRKQVAASPNNARAFFELGNSEARMGNVSGAVQAFEKTIQLDPLLGEAHGDLAIMRYFQKDYTGAWREVNLARERGYSVPGSFLRALKRKQAQ